MTFLHRFTSATRVVAAMTLVAAGLVLATAGTAEAAIPHLTATQVECPTTVTYGSPASCTVTVRDISWFNKQVPTGTASVGTILNRLDVVGTPCTLVAVDGESASCSVTVTATDIGPIAPGAVYNPTGDFIGSFGVTALLAQRADLTVTATSGSRAYGSEPLPVSATFDGFVNGDTEADLHGTLTCVATDDETSIVGEYATGCTGLWSLLYAIEYVDGATTVTPAPLTITADDATRAYGAANPAFDVTYAGFVLGQDPSVLTGTLACATPATTSSPVGTYPISCEGLTLAPTGSTPLVDDPADTGNYAITWVDGALTIGAVPLTVIVDDATRVTGQDNEPFEVSYQGFVDGDTAAELGGTLTCTTTATASSPTGTYAITCDGLTSDNYEISYQAGTLEVLARPTAVVTDKSDLVPGGKVAVDSEGWKPGTTITVTACGTEIGTATADDEGKVSDSFKLPGTLRPGDCELVLSGQDLADKPYAVVLGITLTAGPVTPPTPSNSGVVPAVTAAIGGVLPTTGAAIGGVSLVAIAAIALGAVLVTSTRRRRTTR